MMLHPIFDVIMPDEVLIQDTHDAPNVSPIWFLVAVLILVVAVILIVRKIRQNKASSISQEDTSSTNTDHNTQ